MNSPIAKQMAETYQDFERFEVAARGGSRLTVYELGQPNAPRVVIVNPIGVPIVISSRLARLLAQKCRVICWEQRGYNAESREFFARAHDYSAFLSDLLDVVEQRGAAPCALVGVCSGASLVIRAVAQNLIHPSALVLVSPAVRFNDGYVPSVFDQTFVHYLRMISAGNAQLAKDLLEMRAAAAADGAGGPMNADEQIVDAADKSSMQSVDSLLIYARTVQVFTDQRLDQDIACVTQKAHLFAAVDDKTVSIQTVRQLAKLLPNAQLQEYSSGGHFMVFVRNDVQQAICDAIHSHAVQ